MADFMGVDLHGSRFERVDLSGAELFAVDLAGARFRGVEPVAGPGWPPPRSFSVRECLLIVLNEEWEYRRYAERDLQAVEERSGTREPS
jgi:hypothetical protein